MSVSVQVNDAVHGRPAAGISVRLQRDAGGIWVDDSQSTADDDGLVSCWQGTRLPRGVYQLEIDLDGYFASLGTISLHPAVIIRFRIVDPDYAQHVSLLVTSSAFFTYLQPGPRARPLVAVDNGLAEDIDDGGYA